MKFAVLDTETSGLMDYARPADADGQPRVAEVALIYLDELLNVEHVFQSYVEPNGWTMDPQATLINGLTDEKLREGGIPIGMVLDTYSAAIIDEKRAIVAFGAQFDCKMMRAELRRAGRDDLFEQTQNICLMRSARPFAKMVGRVLTKAGGSNKGWPKLTDLCEFLGIAPGQAHGALSDARDATACLQTMVALGFDPQPTVHHAKDYDAIRNAT